MESTSAEINLQIEFYKIYFCHIVTAPIYNLNLLWLLGIYILLLLQLSFLNCFLLLPLGFCDCILLLVLGASDIFVLITKGFFYSNALLLESNQ